MEIDGALHLGDARRRAVCERPSEDWKHPRAHSGFIDRDQDAGLQQRSMVADGHHHEGSEMVWRDVLGSDLNHARASCPGPREDCPDIKIMREEDEPTDTGMIHDRGIRRARVADLRPMDGMPTLLSESLHPHRWQIHVDEKLEVHPRVTGTSNSSALHAA